jgi:four helix bundle protein
MREIRDHRDLEAWQVAMTATETTYNLSDRFPRAEIYGLTAQMRRAAVSVPSNIAEGYARRGRAEINHLGIALGSFAELDTQLEIAVRRNYLTRETAGELQVLIDSGRRLLHGLRRARRRRLAAAVVTPAILWLLAVQLLG